MQISKRQPSLYLQMKEIVAKGYLSGLKSSHADQQSQNKAHRILEAEDNSPKGLEQADE